MRGTGDRRTSRRFAAVWLFGSALGLLAAVTAACDGDSPAGPDDGALDLSRYVAIGNSLTSGYMNGALGIEGQACSYPRLVAGQAGAGAGFSQPLVAAPGISEPGSGVGRIELSSLAPITIERATPAGQPLNEGQPSPYSNLGVPGALVAEALVARNRATSLTENPFFDLILRGRGTWAEQVAERSASFVTVWLGNNDVLGYVVRGGETAEFPTPASEFAATYEELVTRLLETTDRIVLLNLPPVTVVPYLTAIPTVVIDPTTLDTIPGPGGAPVPLLGPDGPLSPGDQVTFDAVERILDGDGAPVSMGGTGVPLSADVVLDVQEQSVARAAIDAYNAAIAETGARHGLAVVDVHAVVSDIAANGLVVEGQTLTTTFLIGGLFSLDGIHPTCKGQGVIANALIETIGERYGLTIPPVSIAGLPGVTLTAAGDLAPAGAGRGLPRFRRVGRLSF